MNLKNCAPAFAALGYLVLVPGAQAASNCSVSALVETTTRVDQASLPDNPPTADRNATAITADSTTFANYSCGAWNFQGQLNSFYQFPDRRIDGDGGHTRTDFGGYGQFDIFWRDPSKYAVGAGIYHFMDDFHPVGFGTNAGSDFHWYDSWTNAHIFAEDYINDKITLGAGAYVATGTLSNSDDGSNNGETGYGANSYVRFYPQPNIRLGVFGGLDQTVIRFFDYTETSSRYSAGVSAHYKFADTPISVFTSADVGGLVSTYSNGADPWHSTWIEGTAGLKISLGAHANDSLVDEERKGVLR